MRVIFNTRGVKQEVLFPLSDDFHVALNWNRGEKGSFFHLHAHPEAEIQYIKMGAGAYAIGRRIYSFCRRTVFIIKPGEPHRFLPDPRVVTEKICLIFHLNLLNDPHLGQIINRLPATLQLTERDGTLIETSARMINDEINARASYWQEMVAHELRKLPILLQRAAQRKESCVVSDPRLLKALDYLEANFCRTITVKELARFAAMSSSHLAHCFKRQVGMGIRQYLLQRRIAEAKTVLEKSPDIKLAVLAVQLGFCNFAQFNRAFQRLTNISPSNWRSISYAQGRI